MILGGSDMAKLKEEMATAGLGADAMPLFVPGGGHPGRGVLVSFKARELADVTYRLESSRSLLSFVWTSRPLHLIKTPAPAFVSPSLSILSIMTFHVSRRSHQGIPVSRIIQDVKRERREEK
jgi:hypothetical protein